jgi:hypothetical protein
MHPPLPSRIGKTSTRKRIDGTPLVYTVEDEVTVRSTSNPGKAFFFQKLRFDDGQVEYRLCYYMIAHKPRTRGKWAFGQFAPMMTAEEMRLLFAAALAKGWLAPTNGEAPPNPALRQSAAAAAITDV